MTPPAAVLMALSWSLVLGLAFWSWWRVLSASESRRQARRDSADAPTDPADLAD
jgi:hypothetical protein